MRTRRLLLAASALSTLAFGCTKDKPIDKTDPGTTEPLPGNPKGTFYDAAVALPDPVAVDAAPDAPANPPRDAGGQDAAPRDAGVDALRDAATPRPRDAAVRPLPGNPKGSRYDAGTDPDL